MDSTTMNTPASNAQMIVTVPAWGPEPWAEMAGGDITAEAKEVHNGGQLDPDHLRGRRKTADLTVRKPFYPRDKERYDRFLGLAGLLSGEVVAQDTDPDFGAYGNPRIYRGQLSKVGALELKAEGGNANMIELTFSGNWVRTS